MMRAWILFERLEERDLEFVELYRPAAAAGVAQLGGSYKTASFNTSVVEGSDAGPRMIAVKEFPSRATAERWFDSDEYRIARRIRAGHLVNRTMIIDVNPPAYAVEAGAARGLRTKWTRSAAWVIFERLKERHLDFVPEYRRVASASVARFEGCYKTVMFTNRGVEGPDIAAGPGMISCPDRRRVPSVLRRRRLRLLRFYLHENRFCA
jgi:uncharacterized protein (DUF1330 family)